jgi:uncharacterized protein YhaN
MKLLTLNLKAVGPFTDVVLDFAAGEHDLHLIYGPNEAGKTSTLRALSHLLFGFPQRSADNFVHPNDQLRVAGRLRHSSGDELEIIRRRGQKNTLRGPDDAAIVAQEHLARYLDGINQSTFETMFGIDHQRLTQAGEEIRTGQGQLGEMLFAAGAGLAGLSQAQKTLDNGLDELYRPKGQNPRINKGLAELRGIQEELKRRQLSSEEWLMHNNCYQETQNAAEQIREQVRKLRGEQARLKRIRSASGFVARRRRLNQELDALGNVIRLRDDFGVELRNAQDLVRQADNTFARALDALDEIGEQLAHVDPPQILLDGANEIDALKERLGAVEKAAQDRGKLESFQHDAEHEARRILRELGRTIVIDEAETLRLRADEPALIRVLGQRYAQIRGQAEEARRTIARHESQIKQYEAERADLEQPRDIAPLRRAVDQARKVGDLDARLAESRSKIALAEKKAKIALAQLPGWDRPAEELDRMAIPLGATLEHFESQLQEVTSQQHSIAEKLAAVDDTIRQLESRLQSLELHQDVPTEEVLLLARQRRDHGWQIVKAAWLDNAPAGIDHNAFVLEFAPTGTLSSAYEQSVARSDAIADRLRREADRVAHKAEALAQLDRHRSIRAALLDKRLAVDARRARLDRDWNAVVGPLAIDAQTRSPAELRAWLRQREEVVQLLEKVEEIRQSIEPLEHAFSVHRPALIRALVDVGERIAQADSDLAQMLEQAEAVLKRHDDLSQKRAKLETKLATAGAERATAELSLQTAESDLTRWRSEWSSMMARIGLEADATAEQAEVFLTKISELLDKLNDRRTIQTRIHGMDRDTLEFARDVSALASRVAPDLAGRSPADQTRELGHRLRDAQADMQKHTTLVEQREREEGIRLAAEVQREAARVCLERLCNEARCEEIDDLPEAERRSQRFAQLEVELASCEEQILLDAAGTDLAVFIDEVERADPDALAAMINELEAKIAVQEDELRKLDQTIGAERGELARMDGSDGAAMIAEEAQTLLSQLRGDVVRYATLKLAATVMHRGIERYRERNQGPILARAGVLFANLTGTSFARLQIDDDGNGRSVLKGVRPDGRLVDVEAMSDGSHDQLYLALRLASLESWLLSHEPVPFVVDDILLNFDDSRATAALKALAELSRQTQVLFFTHHRHIVDLAHAHLAPEDVFIHNLPGPVST